MGQILQQMVALVTIIGAHAIDMPFKIAVFNKFCKCKLLKIGDSTGIEAQFFIKK